MKRTRTYLSGAQKRKLKEEKEKRNVSEGESSSSSSSKSKKIMEYFKKPTDSSKKDIHEDAGGSGDNIDENFELLHDNEADKDDEKSQNTGSISSCDEKTIPVKIIDENIDQEIPVDEGNKDKNENICRADENVVEDINDDIHDHDNKVQDYIDTSSIDRNENKVSANVTENASVDIEYENNLFENVLPNDPINFRSMGSFTSTALHKFLKLGPCQPTPHEMPGGKFPANNTRHAFSSNHYFMKMSDGNFARRNWLTYSPALDRAFCLSCILFGKPSSRQLPFVKNGSNNWSNITQIIKGHEMKPEHLESEINRSIFQSSLQRVDVEVAKMRNAEVSKNREVVRVLVIIIYYLAKHNMSLRGKQENFNLAHKQNLGNFLDLVFAFAKYHPILASFLTEKANEKSRTVTFLSNKTQDNILSILAETIRKRILEELKDAKYFSVMIDTTTDVGKKDQFSFCVRYTRFNENTREVEIAERLLAVDICEDSTGEGMFSLFVKLCEKHGIDWQHNLIGQAYDGANNMKGQYNGLRALIQKENPKALYVWCYAHILNLVIVDMCDSSKDIRNFLGSIQKMSNFIRIARKRVQIFEEIQKEDKLSGKLSKTDNRIRRLASFSDTRWTSHHRATQCIFSRYDQITKALQTICDTETDREASFEAEVYLDQMRTFPFILTLIIINAIFEITSPLSKYLQKVNIDFIRAYDMVNVALKKIENLRSEAKFQKFFDKAEKFAEDRDLEVDFPTKRVALKKKMPGEKCADEPPKTGEERYRIQCYYALLDTVNTALNDRFSKNMEGIFQECSVLREDRLLDLFKDKTLSDEEISKSFHCFRDWLNLSVSSPELYAEFKCFAEHLPMLKKNACELTPRTWQEEKLEKNEQDEKEEEVERNDSDDEEEEESDEDEEDFSKKFLGIRDIFKLLVKFDLQSTFPNVYIIYKSASTLPVSSATPERSFSKLKLIKTRIRSTMGETRLESLMLISCEGDAELDDKIIEEVINNLADLNVKYEKKLNYH